MRSMPLYDEKDRLPPVFATSHRSREPECRRCPLGSAAPDGARCLAPRRVSRGRDPEAPPALLVFPRPDARSARTGRLELGRIASEVARAAARAWPGPVFADVARRCAAKGGGWGVDACRPFFAAVLEKLRPARVALLGEEPQRLALGRSAHWFSTRGGVAWGEREDGERVAFLLAGAPSEAARAPALRSWLVEDVTRFLDPEREPPAPAWGSEALLVETAEEAEAAARALREAGPFAFDCETFGVPFEPGFGVVSVGCASVKLAGGERAAVYVWERAALEREATRAPLLALLADEAVPKLAHNAKFDALAIELAFGERVRGLAEDTMLLRRLAESYSMLGLDHAAELVAMGGHKGEARAALEDAKRAVARARREAADAQRGLFARLDAEDPALALAVKYPEEKPDRFAYALLPPRVRARYVARDALATARLRDELLRRMDELGPGPRRVWDDVLSKATEAFASIERWGMATDVSMLETLSDYVAPRVAEIEGKLRAMGLEQPGSPEKVARFLFDELGLPAGPRGASGVPSVSRGVLEKLRGKHEAVDLLIERSRLQKLSSAFGRPLARFVRADGRVHPSFWIVGTETGRLSCSDPNLQQIPRGDSVEGKMARDAYVAPPGRVLVQLDYSQLEYRIAAMLAEDEEMAAIFRRGEDVHLATAKAVAGFWGLTPEQVTKRERSMAKGINFGLLYGKGDRGLAEDLGCSVEDAARLRQQILGRFKKLGAWISRQHAEARRTKLARTVWSEGPGRARWLWALDGEDGGAASKARNAAVNTPVQGTASEFCLASVIETVRWIEASRVPAKLVLTVHDSIILEVEERFAREVAEEVRDIMLSWPSGIVPLEVDAEWGPAWGSLEKLPLAA